VVLQLLFDVLLGLLFGVVGVSMATMLSTAVVVVFFGRRLSQVEPDFSSRAMVRTLARASLAILPSALVFGIPIWAGVVQGGFVERVTVLVVAGVAGLGTYYVIARRLGLEEVDAIVWFARDSLFRLLARVGVRT
jgi:putative peptidoglycan lipid II flippase